MATSNNIRKKLIEVALPLPEINDASAYDKRPGIGPHPKGLHHWWARLPLPTARAVLFASVVDAQNAERERLFDIVRRMMGKKLHEQREVYAEASAEMLRNCDGQLPVVFDPFAGGGSIPLEASRLGFEARAGDLNPVAVLLNKCNLELAPRWAERAPVNPEDRSRIGGKDGWIGTQAIARDVRYYGRIIQERARAKIGHLYPKMRLPMEHGGGETNVIAWIWVRTVASPNPAAQGVHVPLASTFWLSSKKGGEAWLEPLVDREKRTWRLDVRTGAPRNPAQTKAGTKTGRAQFRCLLTDAPITDEYIKEEGLAKRLGCQLTAIVAERPRGRAYCQPDESQMRAASSAPKMEDAVNELLTLDPRNIWCVGYGLERFSELFTPRQLAAMVTLSDLVRLVGEDVQRDARIGGLSSEEGKEYAQAVTTFLALALDRCADSNNALCRWDQSAAGQRVKNLFGRQAIPMLWDFAEANILGEKSVCWASAVGITADGIEAIGVGKTARGTALQVDAASGGNGLRSIIVSTDPPYYDNISYAALSDFFYVWLRRTVGSLYPDLFKTVLTPKMPELTAAPERFDGNKERAKDHFEAGFSSAFGALREKMDPRFPLTVYYAFKQADEENSEEEAGDASEDGGTVDLTTGWETLLQSLIGSGFQITGTWPVRASQKWRMRAMGANALASYIVLTCRPQAADAQRTDRRSFGAELKRELPSALRRLQQGNIAPVDLAQAALGPGMAIYSRYSGILDSSGKRVSVRGALALINQVLDELLSEQDADFDSDSRWAIAWFEQNGFDQGEFGLAETLSKAKNTSIGGMEQAGILESKRGKVRLFKPSELSEHWDPTTDPRLTAWEIVHHLVRALEAGGESAAAALVAKLGTKAEIARELAYRLFVVAERNKRPNEALSYNGLVQSWPEIQRLAREARATAAPAQAELL
jgi:putative DNA methylase